MIERSDVVVVGGGPAGAATAIALARAGTSVIVLEQSHYDRVRIGETLPPAARMPLASLDVWNRFVEQGHVASAASISAWGSASIDENHFIFNSHGHGWHLDRTRFDEMLVSVAADCGARVRRGSRMTACVAGATSAGIHYMQGGAVHKIQAEFIVDATGRASVVARQQGARRTRFDRLIGVAGTFSPSSPSSENDPRTLVEAVADGWWYSAWLPQSQAIVAYMTDADLIPRAPDGVGAYWRRQLDKTMHTHARVHRLTLEGPVRIVSACSEVLDPIAGRTWVAIGDAAMSVDPLSSQGICWALKSGLVAARAIQRHMDGHSNAVEELSTWTRDGFNRYWRTHLMHYSREQRWRDSLFWRRRGAGNEVQARVRALGAIDGH
jgi:flavin-dependent dehydrogenase